MLTLRVEECHVQTENEHGLVLGNSVVRAMAHVSWSKGVAEQYESYVRAQRMYLVVFPGVPE